MLCEKDSMFLVELIKGYIWNTQVVEPTHEADYTDLFEEASFHRIGGLVFQQAVNMSLRLPDELFDRWRNDVCCGVARNVRVRRGVVDLMKAFRENGICVAVLKGMVCAAHYPDPELRMSADTDIYLPDLRCLTPAIELLKSKGFYVNPKLNGHHYSCHHPVLGLLELHVALVNDFFVKNWFGKDSIDKITRNALRRISVNGSELTTLDVSDHFIFLVLHAIKHFVLKGLRLIHMIDILLAAHHCRETIDWDRTFGILDGIGLKTWLFTLFTVGEQFFAFSFDGLPFYAPVEFETASSMLGDTMAMKYRFDEKNFSPTMMGLSPKKDFSKFSRAKSGGGAIYIKALFSPKTYGSRYDYAKRHPFLLPAAAIHRVFRYVFLRGRGKKRVMRSIQKTHQVFSERVELFHRLSMTDEYEN